MFDTFRKAVENALHDFLHTTYGAVKPGLDYLKANVPDEAIKLAEALLASAVAGTPWATLIATLITQAEAAGIKLAEQAATVALNSAQNNLIATGTPHLVASA